MVLRAIFAVVYYPKGNSFPDERVLACYEHRGLFAAVLPGGRLNENENSQYENGGMIRRREILVSALKREIKEELGKKIIITPHVNEIHMEEDTVTSHDGRTLNGEIYLMTTELSPNSPLDLIYLSPTPLTYLNRRQLQTETKSKLFGKILSDTIVRGKLGL